MLGAIPSYVVISVLIAVLSSWATQMIKPRQTSHAKCIDIIEVGPQLKEISNKIDDLKNSIDKNEFRNSTEHREFYDRLRDLEKEVAVLKEQVK